MDVQQSSLEALHEGRREDAHESGERDQLRAAGFQLAGERVLERLARGEFPDGDHRGRHAQRRGARQAARAGPVGDHPNYTVAAAGGLPGARDGFHRILRTRRHEPAPRSEQRGDPALVQAQGTDEETIDHDG